MPTQNLKLKFHLPPGTRAAIEASPMLIEAKIQRAHQVTAYFDTRNGTLDRAGLTLGVRQSDDRNIQVIKTHSHEWGTANSRTRWEWPIDGHQPDLREVAKIHELANAAKTVTGRLEQVFVTDIRRATRILQLNHETIAEVTIDQGSIDAGSAREPVSELELNLREGEMGPLYQLALRLHAVAPMWLYPDSQSARGWHLRTSQIEGGQLTSTPKLTRLDRSAIGFYKIITTALGHLANNIGSTLNGDPNALHQMRIAIRESRAALQLFEKYLNVDVISPFNLDLQRFGVTFGTARDWDVFCLETLPTAMGDLPGQRLQDLNLVAEIERQFAHRAVAQTLQGRDFTAVVLGLANWAQSGAANPAVLGDVRMAKPLGDLAVSLLNRVARRAKRRSHRADRLSPVKRHRLRKSVRKLWFDVKLLGGLYPADQVTQYRDRCEQLEKILGHANDAVVTRRLVESLVTSLRPDLADPANILTQWNKRRGHEQLRDFKRAVKDFRRAGPFWC